MLHLQKRREVLRTRLIHRRKGARLDGGLEPLDPLLGGLVPESVLQHLARIFEPAEPEPAALAQHAQKLLQDRYRLVQGPRFRAHGGDGAEQLLQDWFG
jgi:hypothetical protein